MTENNKVCALTDMKQMNWYTKRASLAAVYSSTELYMTQDLSPDYIETEKFLERRLDQAAWLGSTSRQVISVYFIKRESIDICL